MARLLAHCTIDRGYEPRSDQTKDYETGICCFIVTHTASRSKTRWFGIEIMSPSGAICLPAGCCFSELAL